MTGNNKQRNKEKHNLKELIIKSVRTPELIPVVQWIKNKSSPQYTHKPKPRNIAALIKKIELKRKKREQFKKKTPDNMLNIYKSVKSKALTAFNERQNKDAGKAILKYLRLRYMYLKNTPASFLPPYYIKNDPENGFITVKHVITGQASDIIIIKQTVYTKKHPGSYPKSKKTYYELKKIEKTKTIELKEITAHKARSTVKTITKEHN